MVNFHPFLKYALNPLINCKSRVIHSKNNRRKQIETDPSANVSDGNSLYFSSIFALIIKPPKR